MFTHFWQQACYSSIGPAEMSLCRCRCRCEYWCRPGIRQAGHQTGRPHQGPADGHVQCMLDRLVHLAGREMFKVRALRSSTSIIPMKSSASRKKKSSVRVCIRISVSGSGSLNRVCSMSVARLTITLSSIAAFCTSKFILATGAAKGRSPQTKTRPAPTLPKYPPRCAPSGPSPQSPKYWPPASLSTVRCTRNTNSALPFVDIPVGPERARKILPYDFAG